MNINVVVCTTNKKLDGCIQRIHDKQVTKAANAAVTAGHKICNLVYH